METETLSQPDKMEILKAMLPTLSNVHPFEVLVGKVMFYGNLVFHKDKFAIGLDEVAFEDGFKHPFQMHLGTFARDSSQKPEDITVDSLIKANFEASALKRVASIVAKMNA
jgi:hypothetical protein